jgi:hypothetical protein
MHPAEWIPLAWAVPIKPLAPAASRSTCRRSNATWAPSPPLGDAQRTKALAELWQRRPPPPDKVSSIAIPAVAATAGLFSGHDRLRPLTPSVGQGLDVIRNFSWRDGLSESLTLLCGLVLVRVKAAHPWFFRLFALKSLFSFSRWEAGGLKRSN